MNSMRILVINLLKTAVPIAAAMLLAGTCVMVSLGQGTTMTAQVPAGQNPAGQPGTAIDDATYAKHVSYMLGLNIGSDLKENQVPIDLQTLVAGITDGLSGAKPRLSEAQLTACRDRFGQEMRVRAAARVQEAGDRNAKQAAEFLANNANQPGVQTSPSGLQYKVLAQGTGATPGLTDKVRFHYRGTLIDGTEFDSSMGREPAEMAVNDVIPGWAEALQKMRVGDKWQLVVPADLAYGIQGRPGTPIEPNSLLIFEVELLGIGGK